MYPCNTTLRNNGDISFESTNNGNSFTERLSDNSDNQVLGDKLKVTDQKKHFNSKQLK